MIDRRIELSALLDFMRFSRSQGIESIRHSDNICGRIIGGYRDGCEVDHGCPVDYERLCVLEPWLSAIVRSGGRKRAQHSHAKTHLHQVETIAKDSANMV